MKVSDIIRAMSDAGAPMEAILIAVQAIEAKEAEIHARDAVSSSKRAKDAARKRAERDAARNVHGQSTDGHRTVQDIPSLSPSPLPFPQTPKPTPRPHTHPDTQSRARKGHRLPDDWQPEPFDGQLAVDVAAWPVGAIERELAKFRDWAASAPGQRGVKSNWQATWRNWIRRKIDDGTHKDIRASGANGHRGRSSLARAIDEGFASLGT